MPPARVVRPRSSIALLLLLAPLLARGATLPAPPTDRDLGFYGGTRDEVLALCKRVGLVPYVGPLIAGGDPEAYARVEPMVARALTEAGFEVIDAQPYRTAFERFARAVGGLYDPMNGTLRKDAYGGVYQNATREFITQGQLGCIAMVRGLDVKAHLAGAMAGWDGALEYVDGEQKGGLARFWSGGGGGSGQISAISLMLQLLNREGKVVYGRLGGVQLGAYFNHERGKDDDILEVPREKLLQDDKRLDRAVRRITIPLRYTAAEIAAGTKDPALNTAEISPNDLPPPPPGSRRSRPSGLLAPRDQILSTVHRVLMGPLFPGTFTPSPAATAQFRGLVRVRLEKLGWEVVESDQMETAFGAAFAKAGGIYDPATGKADDAKVSQAVHGALAALGTNPAPDAVLWISLVKNTASQRFGNAAWDGAEQNALTLGAATKGSKLFGGTEDGTAGEGTIAAASLGFVLRDRDGRILYNQRGGIQLIQQLSIKSEFQVRSISYKQQLADLAPTELFGDAARNERAVDLAMRELMLSAEQIAAEDQPKVVPAKR